MNNLKIKLSVALVICLVAGLLVQNRDKKSGRQTVGQAAAPAKRTSASVATDEPKSAAPVVDSEKKPNDRNDELAALEVDAKKESDSQRKERMRKKIIGEIRKGLKPETLKWMEKLPHPESIEEERILVNLGLAYQSKQLPDLASDAMFTSSYFSFISTDDYLDRCLAKLDSRSEHHLKGFLFLFIQKARPSHELSLMISSQLDIYFENPNRYSDADYRNLAQSVGGNSGFEDDYKNEILLQMWEVRDK